MQDYLRQVGYDNIKGPRPTLVQMAKDNFIDAFIWGDMLTARNELSHIYDEQLSRNYLNNLLQDFLPAFQNFRDRMQQV